MQGTKLWWHQAGGRNVTPKWHRVVGTDGTADVGQCDIELVQEAGGSARGGEVTLRGCQVALGCQ